jgi:hypothetical protein
MGREGWIECRVLGRVQRGIDYRLQSTDYGGLGGGHMRRPYSLLPTSLFLPMS